MATLVVATLLLASGVGEQLDGLSLFGLVLIVAAVLMALGAVRDLRPRA